MLVLFLSGKFGAAGSFALIYLYTAELYPTEIRGTAVGLCCMFARVGGFVAPQVIYSDDSISLKPIIQKPIL